jgi:hypothetical protein
MIDNSILIDIDIGWPYVFAEVRAHPAGLLAVK